MNYRLTQFIAAVLGTGILLTGCANLADVLTETISKTIDPSDTKARERGEASEQIVLILSTHLATEQERRTAEERALRADHALRANQSLLSRQRHPFRRTRYIAVNADSEGNSQGGTSVMFYDSQKHVLLSNVSELSQTPKAGSILEVPKNYFNGEVARDPINVSVRVRDVREPVVDPQRNDSVLYLPEGEISTSPPAH
jgi:hypothetical protein